MDRIIKTYKKVAHLRPSGFWPGFIVGLVYFSYILWWFWSGSVYISTLLGTTGHTLSFLVILPTFIATVAGVSLFWGLFSYIVYNSKKFQPALMPFFYAGAFVLLEYLRTLFVGIILYGTGGTLGANWTFGNPAYLFVNIGPLRESASYWGIYGVDFLIIFLGTAIFLLVKHWRGNKIMYTLEMLSAIVIVLLFLFSSNHDQDNKFSASIIQTKNPVSVSIAPEDLLSDFSKKNELLREASKKSDMVVFPESADFSKTLSNFLDPASIPKYFSDLSQKNILIVDSDRVPEQEGLKSKVVLIDSKDGVVGSYDKLLLTPGGEYFPYISRLTLLVLAPFLKTDLTPFKVGFSRGTGSNLLYHKDHKIKLLVCSDIISPSISRKGGEFDFMVNLRNLAVFGGNPLIEQQLQSMARFRAAENDKYLIIASNFGRSYVIDNNGNITKSTDSKGYELLTADIVPNKERTWYNKLGDLPILLLSLAIFVLGFKKFRDAKQD